MTSSSSVFGLPRERAGSHPTLCSDGTPRAPRNQSSASPPPRGGSGRASSPRGKDSGAIPGPHCPPQPWSEGVPEAAHAPSFFLTATWPSLSLKAMKTCPWVMVKKKKLTICCLHLGYFQVFTVKIVKSSLKVVVSLSYYHQSATIVTRPKGQTSLPTASATGIFCPPPGSARHVWAHCPVLAGVTGRGFGSGHAQSTVTLTEKVAQPLGPWSELGTSHTLTVAQRVHLCVRPHSRCLGPGPAWRPGGCDHPRRSEYPSLAPEVCLLG